MAVQVLYGFHIPYLEKKIILISYLSNLSITFIIMLIHTLSLVIGMDDPNNPSISIKDALKDGKRIKYHNDYLVNLLASIKYVTYFIIM